ncbi:hypothetical protein HA402_005920 [Bradysia odoriphaga]|nr:hypothetical protein HA402_005920 [Bradysia odoriphaga]
MKKKFKINQLSSPTITGNVQPQINGSTISVVDGIDDTKTSKSNICDSIEDPMPTTWKFWQKRRYLVILMAFLGFCNVYTLRVNLSVGIVAMTENRTVHYDNGTVGYEQYFAWNSKEQGLILSSFFYGYITTQFIGGYFGAKVGGSLVFGVGIFATSVLTLLTPLAARAGFEVLMAVRIIEGIFEGVTFPCIQDVWSRWAPPPERSRAASISFAGTYAGTVIAMPLSGVLAAWFGWESLFYVFGAIGCIWFIAWIIIVKRGPELDRYISKEELHYIQSSLGSLDRDEKASVPWKAIFTSKAVFAICVSHTAETWGLYTFITQLPTFLRDAMNYNLGKTGFLSALPYLAMGVLLLVFGYFADLFQIKGWLTTTQVRRYFNCLGFVAQAIFMLLAAYLLHPVWSLVSIILAVGLGALAWCGFSVNPLDIAPNYASIIFGIQNTVGTLPGIISPTLTGYLVQNKTAEEWRIVFYITAIVYGIGTVVYWFWCSGELQPWAKGNFKKDSTNNKSDSKINA